MLLMYTPEIYTPLEQLHVLIGAAQVMGDSSLVLPGRRQLRCASLLQEVAIACR